MPRGEGLRVAIQGEPGAFSHAAALALVGGGLELVPTPDFEALFLALSEERADRALVPIENTLTGSIHENYDRLRASTFHVIAETRLRIRQCLIGRPGAALSGLHRVASHPVALAQCRHFFASHPEIEPVPAADTAGSVRELMDVGDAGSGAIASQLAAELYGAQLMQADIEDDPENHTRFLLLAREPGRVEGTAKTSIVFTLENRPGALYGALQAFASRGVDLTKIESRPLRGRPFEYAFYLDLVGDPAREAGDAIAELRSLSRELRVLGSYPEGLKRPPVPS
jgi:prephenate dehydratase